MKLLVFAHVPPPHHGQSQMVKYLVDGLATADFDIECFHINAQLSDDLSDIGRIRIGKIWQLLLLAGRALSMRFRYGVRYLYYVPSPPKRSSLYRDWMLMALLRPWFRGVVFHWHSVGLGEWLQQNAKPWERWISHRLLNRNALSLVLSKYNESDAKRLNPRNVTVVPNGIPDPCPDLANRQSSPEIPKVIRVLYLALCTREKGVHDATEGVLRANALAEKRGLPFRFHLTVAGSFVDRHEEADFQKLCEPAEAKGLIDVRGFLDAEAKDQMFRSAHVFCFPTYYANEGQPLNLIEAMAYDLPLVTTRWRAIPEYLPENYPGLVEPRSPSEVAEALLRVVLQPQLPGFFRQTFLNRYTLESHLTEMTSALKTIESL